MREEAHALIDSEIISRETIKSLFDAVESALFRASWERMVFCACLEQVDVLKAYIAARRYLDTGNECGLDMAARP